MAAGPIESLVGAVCCFGAWWWIWLFVVAVRNRRAFVRLDEVPPLPEPPDTWPEVAILFAARDEEKSVARAVRSMLDQNYPPLRVVAVNDRSSDSTGAILDALAGENPRLSVIHIDELPAGWLGKTHALQAGAASVDPSCEWLLFTDADVVFAPDTLRRALALAQRDHLDLMAAAPDIVTVSLAERIFIAFFSMIFALAVPPWRVNDPKSRAAVGVGAFNLVRRSTFRDVGGLSHIALSVDDDVRFAQAVKFAGYRCALVSGTRALSVRWHVGMLGMIRGLEKNFFGACDYRLVTALAGAAGFLMLGVLPFLGLLVGPWWMRLFCAIGIGAIALMIQGARGLDGLAWYHALGFPVASVALIFALLRSTVLTYVRGGVRWRDHLYPLPLLRDHCRRRNAWLRELWLSTR